MDKKKTAKAALATFGLSLMLPSGALAATDTYGHWAQSTLAKWESQNLISGYDDGTLRPNNQISRAEFVTLVNKVAGYPVTSAYVTFGDVASHDWFAAQIASGLEQGYIGGFEDGTFRPYDAVSRAQAAVMIAKLKHLSYDEFRAEQFADADSIPAWAKGAVGAVANAGYMIGDEANRFNGQKALTRAEAVAALDNVFQVKEAPAQERLTLNLNEYSGTLYKGGSKTITAKPSLADAVIAASSSDEEIATVTVEGKSVIIKGISTGTVTITVSASLDGHPEAHVTYTATVALAGGGGGGGSSSGGGFDDGGSSNISATVTTPKDKINSSVPGVTAENVSIQTTVYKDNVANDAQTIVSVPDAVQAIAVELPPSVPSFQVAGTNVTLTQPLNSSILKGDNTPQTFTVSDLDGKVDTAAQAKLDQLAPDRVLITCTPQWNGNLATFTWDVDGMSAQEQQKLFQEIGITLN